MMPEIVAVRDQPFVYAFSNSYGDEERIAKTVSVEVFAVRHNQRAFCIMVANMLRDKERNPWKR